MNLDYAHMAYRLVLAQMNIDTDHTMNIFLWGNLIVFAFLMFITRRSAFVLYLYVFYALSITTVFVSDLVRIQGHPVEEVQAMIQKIDNNHPKDPSFYNVVFQEKCCYEQTDKNS